MTDVGVAATQMTCSWDRAENLNRAEKLVRQAASAGASIILIQELFETPYFPIEQSHKHRSLACSLKESEAVKRFSNLARELEVVLPISFFEKAGEVYFNSVAVADADGTLLGVIGNHTFQMPRDTKKKSTSVQAILDFASGGHVLAM